MPTSPTSSPFATSNGWSNTCVRARIGRSTKSRPTTWPSA